MYIPYFIVVIIMYDLKSGEEGIWHQIAHPPPLGGGGGGVMRTSNFLSQICVPNYGVMVLILTTTALMCICSVVCIEIVGTARG